MGTLHPVSVLEDVFTTPRPAVRAAGEAFALELAHVPEDELARWIVAMLAELEAWTPRSAYAAVLASLAAAIDARRLAGKW